MQLVAPARGSIYDRFGRTVAEDKENFRVIVVPAFCKDLAATLDAVAKIIRVSPADKDRVIRAARRQSGYFPVLVTEGLTWRQFSLLSLLAPQLPGVRADRATYRRYNHGRGMAHVVGYVGMADKNEVDEDPLMRVPGFRTGKAGHRKGPRPRAQGTARHHQIRGRCPRPRRPPARRDAERARQGPGPHHRSRAARHRAQAHRGLARGLHRRARRGDRRHPGDGVLTRPSTPTTSPSRSTSPVGRSWRETGITRWKIASCAGPIRPARPSRSSPRWPGSRPASSRPPRP